MKKILTIAGSDSSGGAGIQGDLKTFSAHGVFGMSVITAVTAQNTQGVFGVQDITAEMIEMQIQAIFEDIIVDAVKIGMLSRSETIKAIVRGLKKYNPPNVVLDPVMISTSGYFLLQPEAIQEMITSLLPLVTMITPNIPEAEELAKIPITSLTHMEEAARIISNLGPLNVLVKGGHRDGDAVDVLFDGHKMTHFKSPRIDSSNTHGTGCTLSAAIASNLGKGYSTYEGVVAAKEYITTAITHSFSIGKGVGPVHHFYDLYQKAGRIEDK